MKFEVIISVRGEHDGGAQGEPLVRSTFNKDTGDDLDACECGSLADYVMSAAKDAYRARMKESGA